MVALDRCVGMHHGLQVGGGALGTTFLPEPLETVRVPGNTSQAVGNVFACQDTLFTHIW